MNWMIVIAILRIIRDGSQHDNSDGGDKDNGSDDDDYDDDYDDDSDDICDFAVYSDNIDNHGSFNLTCFMCSNTPSIHYRHPNVYSGSKSNYDQGNQIYICIMTDISRY